MTRRVTGFFAKKMPKLDKKQKSTDKVETTEPAAVETNADTTLPAVVPETVATQEHHQPTLVANEAAEDATGVKVTETNPVLAATTTNTA